MVNLLHKLCWWFMCGCTKQGIWYVDGDLARLGPPDINVPCFNRTLGIIDRNPGFLCEKHARYRGLIGW